MNIDWTDFALMYIYMYVREPSQTLYILHRYIVVGHRIYEYCKLPIQYFNEYYQPLIPLGHKFLI